MRSNWGHFEIGWIVHLEHWRGSWGENQLFTPKIRSFREPKCWLLLNRLLDMYVDISKKKKNADHGISVLLQASQYNNVEFQVHSQDFLVSLVLEVFAELKILVVKWCPTGFLQTFHRTKHCSPCLSASLLTFSCFLFKIKIFSLFLAKYSWMWILFLAMNSTVWRKIQHSQMGSFVHLQYFVSSVLRRQHCEKQKKEVSRDALML